ncbi:MAG: hypothetical protein WBG42_14525 [Cryomorphaceae bacterium]
MIGIKDLKDDLYNGLLRIILNAQHHYYTHRLIGENSTALNQNLKNEYDLSRKFYYLQESGRQGAILNLAKYFEGKSNNKNYCLRRFLDQCKSNISNKFDPPAYLDSPFIGYLNIEIGGTSCTLKSIHNLFELIDIILSRPQVTNYAKDIKDLRDKTIAHHDKHSLQPMGEFWLGYEYLLYLSRLINEALLYHLYSSYSSMTKFRIDQVVDEKICTDQYWLDTEIKAIVGDEFKNTLPEFSDWYRTKKFTEPNA